MSKDKGLREILNGVYLDAKGIQEIDERIANGTVSLAQANILKLVPSEEEMKNVCMKFTPDLVEDYFPKGECKERGQALVLHAEMILKICPAIYSLIIKKLTGEAS